MVRELKEIVTELADIDTTVDIEDVQCIASMLPDADVKIRALREFLTQLQIKTEPETVPEVIQMLTKIYEPEPETTKVLPLKTADTEYMELREMGFSDEQIRELKQLYDSRKTAKKMSFVVCMKACKFVSDKLKASKVRVLKSKVVPLLHEYLKMIDPTVEYNVCNVHDFLKGVALGNISKRFFKFESGYLVGVKQT